MEADLQTQTADPVAAPTDAAAVPSGESASPSSQQATTQTESFDMNDWIRGQATGQPVSTSKPDGVVPTAELDAARDGESAPSGDVKPSDQSGQQPGTGRRGAAARISELEAENQRLKATLDEVNPPPPDASEEERKAFLANEQRYRRLLTKAWDDPDWTQEDIDFLEGEKKTRALTPKLTAHYQAVLDDDLRTREEEYQGKYAELQDYVLRGMHAVKGMPGIDFDAVLAAPDFHTREQLIATQSYQAGRSEGAAENARLREENASLRRDLGGAVRTPPSGGESGPAVSADINSWIRRQAGFA